MNNHFTQSVTQKHRHTQAEGKERQGLNRDVRNGLVKCKRCGSVDVWRCGKTILSGRILQRYKCKNCGFLFNGEVIKYVW
jgi:predicted RNA-binding Zn-ribbon protein involved in translation (DUF1610 family)